MAESESTTTAGDAEEPTALISHTFLDEEKACWHAPDVRSDLLLVFPVPLSPITMEHRVTKETMSPIQTANTHDPSRQADSTPQTMDLRRSTRSHAFKRKIIGFKEEDTSPLIDNYDDEDEDAVSGGSGGDPSVEKSAGALVNLAGKIPLKKPRHKKASKKDEPESQQRAAAAAVTGPSDGTVNIIMTMGGVRGSDSGYQCTAVATPRKQKFKPTLQSVSAQKECDNQLLSLVYAPPPTLLERQSTLDHLNCGALPVMPLTLSPRLTGWYQMGILTQQPDDIAVSPVFEDHRETTRRSSVIDRYRAIVLQWPPLVVQINKASVRTKDGCVIGPPLLPPLTTTRAGSTASSTAFLDAVKKAAPDALLFGSIGHTNASTTTPPYHTKLPATVLVDRCRSTLDGMQVLARTRGRSTRRWPT
jgi:hypothetical protein